MSLRQSPKVISRIKRAYTDIEEAFLTSTKPVILKENEKFLLEVNRILDTGRINKINSLKIDLKGYREPVYNLLVNSYRAGRVTGLIETLELKQYYERKNQKVLLENIDIVDNVLNGIIDTFTTALNSKDKEKVKKFSVLPYKALKFYSGYSLKLKGVLDQDLLQKVKGKIYKGIETGLSIPDIKYSIEDTLPSFSDWRLTNIARTETSNTMSKSRMESFSSSEVGGFIVAAQFSSIMDGRTTKICEDRHGIIARLNNPWWNGNTPSLHYQCRSTVIPVSKYDIIEEGLENKIDVIPAGLESVMEGFGFSRN